MLGLAMAGIVARPLTCPPLTADAFPYERLAEADLIYIALHGGPKARVLYGDGQIPALTIEKITDGPSMHAVVILEGCYGAKTAFPQAFLQKGASAVIGSTQQTFDRRIGLGPAGHTGMKIARRLRDGLSPVDAVRDSDFILVEVDR